MTKSLQRANIGLDPHRITRYVVTTEPNTTLKDLLVPAYWRLIDRLAKNNFIIVFFPDNDGFAELRVLEVGPGYVKVQVIADFTVPAIPAVLPSGKTLDEEIEDRAGHKDYTVRFLADKWGVVQKGVNNPIYTDFPDEESAKKKLIEHLDKVNGVT